MSKPDVLLKSVVEKSVQSSSKRKKLTVGGGAHDLSDTESESPPALDEVPEVPTRSGSSSPNLSGMWVTNIFKEGKVFGIFEQELDRFHDKVIRVKMLLLSIPGLIRHRKGGLKYNPLQDISED